MTASKNAFPKTERLKKAAEFRNLLKNGQLICENGVCLYFAKSSQPKTNRFGVVIKRSVLKHAVDRNRVKRIAREFFRLRKPEFQDSFDLIVRISDSSKLFNQNSLSEILTHLFHHAGVLRCDKPSK